MWKVGIKKLSKKKRVSLSEHTKVKNRTNTRGGSVVFSLILYHNSNPQPTG